MTISKKNIGKIVEHVIKNSRYAENIASVSLFGSHANGTAHEQSDIDLMVNIQKPIGIFALMRLKNMLEDHLQAHVDITTEQSVNTNLQKYILPTAQKIYEKR